MHAYRVDVQLGYGDELRGLRSHQRRREGAFLEAELLTGHVSRGVRQRQHRRTQLPET